MPEDRKAQVNCNYSTLQRKLLCTQTDIDLGSGYSPLLIVVPTGFKQGIGADLYD